MPSLVSKIPLGKLRGGAQDDVELALARDILKLEAEIGQAKNTLDIAGVLARVNKEHALVSAEELPELAANVKRAYGYVSEQQPLAISRAGYKSYAAEEAVKNVRQKVKHLGDVAKDALSKPRPA